MKYATKIRKVEAIRYTGDNKKSIQEFLIGQPEDFVYEQEDGSLLTRFGVIHLGNWLVLDRWGRILTHDQFISAYEEANGDDLWSIFLDLFAVVCGEVNRLGEQREYHHMYQEYLSAKEYIERRLI